MTTWFDDPFRPTRDVDFLGFGDPDPEAMAALSNLDTAIANHAGVLEAAGRAQAAIRTGHNQMFREAGLEPPR